VIRRVRTIVMVLCLLSTVSAIPSAAKAQSTPLETQVKATFLAKFAAYVNWPPEAMGTPDAPIQLCVVGRDPFGPELDRAVAHQHVDLHGFAVRRLAGTSGAAGCHVAFLGGSPSQSVVAMAEALRGKPVLTVTDADLGPGRGMVHFLLKDGRVRFHIDDARAAQGNLAISARLLSLALSVKPRTQPS